MKKKIWGSDSYFTKQNKIDIVLANNRMNNRRNWCILQDLFWDKLTLDRCKPSKEFSLNSKKYYSRLANSILYHLRLSPSRLNNTSVNWPLMWIKQFKIAFYTWEPHVRINSIKFRQLSNKQIPITVIIFRFTKP